jgi:hypothetical protein
LKVLPNQPGFPFAPREELPLLQTKSALNRCPRPTQGTLPISPTKKEVAENLRTADSAAQKRKGFCSNCGSPLYNRPQNKPDMIGIYVGTLDDPSAFKPQIVTYASCGHSRDYLDPALP